MYKSVVDVCVCEHLWLQSGVGLRVHVFGFSVQESVSERVVRHGISEVTHQIKKNSDLAVVSVCVYLVFSIVNGCVVVSAFWQRVVCVSWSVVCVIMWVQSGFGGWCAFACMSAGFCWLFKVVKGVWIWRHKKRARNQPQKVGKPK